MLFPVLQGTGSQYIWFAGVLDHTICPTEHHAHRVADCACALPNRYPFNFEYKTWLTPQATQDFWMAVEVLALRGLHRDFLYQDLWDGYTRYRTRETGYYNKFVVNIRVESTRKKNNSTNNLLGFGVWYIDLDEKELKCKRIKISGSTIDTTRNVPDASDFVWLGEWPIREGYSGAREQLKEQIQKVIHHIQKESFFVVGTGKEGDQFVYGLMR